MAPRDPILGVTEAFNADPNPNKVNLGVGVYYDDNGKVPLLECVRRAEQQARRERRAAQLPADRRPAGLRPRGAGSWSSARTATALQDGPRRHGAGARAAPAASRSAPISCGGSIPAPQVWISEPSWENHRALFENAGFAVNTYPYYDAATHGLEFRRDAGGAAEAARRARSSCCTRAATTRPASI